MSSWGEGEGLFKKVVPFFVIYDRSENQITNLFLFFTFQRHVLIRYCCNSGNEIVFKFEGHDVTHDKKRFNDRMFNVPYDVGILFKLSVSY